jgi:hypothetical protein
VCISQQQEMLILTRRFSQSIETCINIRLKYKLQSGSYVTVFLSRFRNHYLLIV